MRPLLLAAVLLPLAACGGKESGDNVAAGNDAAAIANMPAPTTPVLNLEGERGTENPMAPQNGAADPKSAPYGDVLAEPVVNAPSQPR